mmetsp:Transcript_51159/g.112046  ORF Transcript_51159/g.112046 Transcript_51159/m.112046 type:complete len:203 (-) Transcript_51159:272-880(-)
MSVRRQPSTHLRVRHLPEGHVIRTAPSNASPSVHVLLLFKARVACRVEVHVVKLLAFGDAKGRVTVPGNKEHGFPGIDQLLQLRAQLLTDRRRSLASGQTPKGLHVGELPMFPRRVSKLYHQAQLELAAVSVGCKILELHICKKGVPPRGASLCRQGTMKMLALRTLLAHIAPLGGLLNPLFVLAEVAVREIAEVHLTELKR